jgi:hypothetical protein
MTGSVSLVMKILPPLQLTSAWGGRAVLKAVLPDYRTHLPLEVVQLFKIGYATIYEDASPSRREGREVRAGRGSM